MKEQVIFEGHPSLKAVWNPLKKHSLYLTITSERIILSEGIIGKKEVEILLVNVHDVSMYQSLIDRILNVGEIRIRSTDRENPRISFYMKKPRKWREKISKLVREEKERRGVEFQEGI